VYVTAPGTTLRVPAHTGLLANDRDPRGLRLRPSVTKISFGKATHPYTVAANGAFTLKTTKKDRRLVMTYSAVNSKGARSAPTTALVLVTTRRLTDDQLRSCDGSGRVVQPPPRGPRFLTKSCTGMAVQTTTFQVTDKKKGIKGTLTYGIRKPKGNNLCWERGWPTSDDVWKVRGQAWVKWSGTPAKPDAIGFTDTIKVNGTSMSVSVPISVSVTESGGSVKMKVTNTKKGTTSAADLDYRTVDIKVSAYSSGTISHTISPFVKIKGSTKVAKAAGDHNCVKASLSGYYWGETYSNCF
jgi:hypothetical protein